MAEHPLIALLVRLHDRTNEGQLAWEETSSPDVFFASFPKYTVRIERDRADYFIRILDVYDDLVDEASDEDLQRTTKKHDIAEMMRSLYANARRSAKDAGEAVQSILDDLENVR